MEALASVFSFLQSPAGASVLGGLFLISEALASIPSIQSNSVFQLIFNLLKKCAPSKP